MARNGRKVKIYSALEVANICGVVNQTAINWIRNGHLKAFTTPGGQYRVYAEDLTAFLDARGMRIPEDVNDSAKSNIEWNTILVVDDDRELNDLLVRWIEKKLTGYQIIQAYDGFEAGRKLTEIKPGFVILDIDLPGINGFDLCRKIKEDPCFGKPFVIIITGLDLPDSKKTQLNTFSDAFYSKPMNFEDLTLTIKELEKKIGSSY